MRPPWEGMLEGYPKNEGTPHMTPQTRRELTMIGEVGGGLAMHQPMTARGHAAETQFPGPPNPHGRTADQAAAPEGVA